MSDTFIQSFSKSIIYFKELCVPQLHILMPGYNFMSIECVSTDEHKKLLDMSAGIDVWVYNSYGIRGLASRIQYGKAYNTFTIKKERASGTKTEYKKRVEAIEKNYLYPFYTMQAYIDINKNQLISLAVCQTQSLFTKISNNQYCIKNTGSNQNGQAAFYIIDWKEFDNNEIKIFSI